MQSADPRARNGRDSAGGPTAIGRIFARIRDPLGICVFARIEIRIAPSWKHHSTIADGADSAVRMRGKRALMFAVTIAFAGGCASSASSAKPHDDTVNAA